MGLGRCVVTHTICTGMQEKKFHALWSLSYKFVILLMLCNTRAKYKYMSHSLFVLSHLSAL